MFRSRQLKASSPAEFLLECGRALYAKVRRGVGIDDAAKQSQSPLDYCALALAFVRSSDLLKLRAMVEDWTCERIARELGMTRTEIETGSLALVSPDFFVFIPIIS